MSMRIPLLFAVCWFATLPASAQGAPQSVPGERAWVKGVAAEAPISVPAPAIVPVGERTASFVVNYTGFSNEAQEAFQYAVDIPHHVGRAHCHRCDLGGFAGQHAGLGWRTSLWYNFGGAPFNNVLYPSPSQTSWQAATWMAVPIWWPILTVAQTGISGWTGIRLSPSMTSSPWCSMKFAGTMYVGVDLNGYVLNGSLAHIYDAFVYTGDSESVLDFGSGTAAMAEALLGDNLYWAGVNATAYSGEFSPKLYAPEFWEQGSSLSHFDEVTYPAGDEHSLMTPAIGNGEAVHSPGPMALGLLEDIGWTVDYDALIDNGGCGSDVDEDGVCDMWMTARI